MKEEGFIQIIEKLRETKKAQKGIESAFRWLDKDNDCLYFGNSSDIIIELLTKIMKDENNWIDYYCNELNFGKRFKSGMVTIEGKPIKLKTAKDLYLILTRHYGRDE